jgi:hypothetical protein
MNIFALDLNPKQAAQFHLDKHVVKMPLETSQMLCTTISLQGLDSPYKACFINHPCTIWVRESKQNFIWLCLLGIHLCDEYQVRYSKEHKCKAVIKYCLKTLPKLSFDSDSLKPFALAMPEQCIITDFQDEFQNRVESYRNYYKMEKSRIATWKTNKPKWYENHLS